MRVVPGSPFARQLAIIKAKPPIIRKVTAKTTEAEAAPSMVEVTETNLTPRQQFEYLVRQGTIPEGSELIRLNDDNQIEYYTPEQVKKRNAYNTAIDKLKPAEKADGTYDINKLITYAKNNQDTYKQTFNDIGLEIPESFKTRFETMVNMPVGLGPMASAGGAIEPGWVAQSMSAPAAAAETAPAPAGEIPEALKDYPVYVKDQYRQAVDEGRDVVKAVNDAIEYYNGFLKRTEESRLATVRASGLYTSKLAELAEQITGKGNIQSGVSKKDYERSMELAKKFGDAYKKANSLEEINKAIDIIDRRIEEQNNAVATLQTYKNPDGYDVGGFVVNNPYEESIELLTVAGFDQEAIAAAQAYIQATKEFYGKKKDYQVFIVGQALGFKARNKANKGSEPLDNLTTAERNEVLKYYVENKITDAELKSLSLQILKDEWKEAGIIYGLAALGAAGSMGLGALSTAATATERLALAGLGGYGECQAIMARNKGELSKAQFIIYTTMNAFMMLPLAYTAGKPLYKWVMEPGKASKQRIEFTEIVGKKSDSFIKDAIPKGAPNRTAVIELYGDFIDATRLYGRKMLELEQARYAKNEIGFAKTKSEYRLLELTNNKIKQLELETAKLRDSVIQKGNLYTAELQKGIKVDDPTVKDEINNLPKYAIRDMEITAEKIVAPRGIKDIKTDIDNAVREIGGLEREGKLKGTELITQTDYLNRLNVELYYARIAELNRAYKIAMKAPMKAKEMGIEGIPEGELLEVEALKRFPEGIEKTTETMAGRETYTAITEKLDRLYFSILKQIKDSNIRAQVRESIQVQKIAIALKDMELLQAAKKYFELATKDIPKQLKEAGSGWYKDISSVWKESEYYVKSDGKSAWDVFKSEPEIIISKEARIKSQVDRILLDRWQRLTERLPESIRRRSESEIREYLEERYGKEEISDQLDPEKIEAEIRAEERAGEETKTRIESREKELDLYKKWKDKVKDQDTKKKLQDMLDTANKQQKRDKELLTQVKEKVKEPLTKTAKPGEQLPETLKERMPARKPGEYAERIREQETRGLPGTEKKPGWVSTPAEKRTRQQTQEEKEWEREFQRAMPAQRQKMLEELGYDIADSRTAPYIKMGVIPAAVRKGLPLPYPKPQTMPYPAISPIQKTAPAPSPAPKPEVSPMPAPVVSPIQKVAPVPAPAPKPEVKPSILPRVIATQKYETKIRIPEKFPLVSHEDAEKLIKMAGGGAIAINMGELHGKRIWDCVTNPYLDNRDYFMVMGRPPKGATIIKKGKGSAYATAQMLRGQPPQQPVNIDKGIMDIRLTSVGPKITAEFKPDPKGLTKGDITIGKKQPRISPRQPRVSQKLPRISGKMPVLR